MSELGINDFWIIATALLIAWSGALLGIYLVLKRISLLSDAISHTILLGIVLAFIILGYKSDLLIIIFATLTGLTTAYLSNFFSRSLKIQEDTAIGIVFTFLFSLGVILVSVFGSKVDLDLDCILYGELAFVPFTTSRLFGLDVPIEFLKMFFVFILNITFISLFNSRLKICAFDPIFTKTLGIKVDLWFYLLMTFVSLSCVGAFNAVGAILVIGMMVIPANIALLFAFNIKQAFLISLISAFISVIFGYYFALKLDVNISAMIVSLAGILFLILASFKLIYFKLLPVNK